MADEAGSDLLEVSQTETTSNWYSPENAEVVERTGWKNGDDAIKGYRELEKNYSGRVKMPSPESSAEEIRSFYQKTGCPENPDGYELPEQEGDFPQNESMEKAMRQIAYDMGVTKQSFEAIVKGYYDQMNADMVASKEAGERVLKEDLGDKYDEEIGIAVRFLDTCSEDFCGLAKQLGLLNNPIFIKEFIAKGKQILDDTLIKSDTQGDKAEGDYTPAYPDSPEMYANGDDEDSTKGREWHTARGYKY